MAKAHLKVHMGGIATAIEFYQTAPTPNLIILESREEPQATRRKPRPARRICDPTSKVVVIGHYNDVGSTATSSEVGISEYMVAPISLADIRSRHLRHLRRSGGRPIGTLDRLRRRQGRRRLLDDGPQRRLDHVDAVLVGSRGRRSRPRLRHRQHQFRPGPGAGHRGGGVLARAHRRGLSRPPARAMRRAPVAARRTLDAGSHLRFRPDAFTQIIETAQRSAPLLVLDVPHMWSGWSKQTCCRPTKWSSPRRPNSPICATPRTWSTC
jgi:pilus assembly protein CpaE